MAETWIIWTFGCLYGLGGPAGFAATDDGPFESQAAAETFAQEHYDSEYEWKVSPFYPEQEWSGPDED